MPRADSSMKLEAKKLLFDVIKACDDVEQFTTGKALDDYLAGEMLRAAVERKFEIIGEALVRLRAKDEETFRQISASQQAITFRNRLIHGYDAIDHQTVWETVRTTCPPSKPKPNTNSLRSAEIHQFYVERSTSRLQARAANPLKYQGDHSREGHTRFPE